MGSTIWKPLNFRRKRGQPRPGQLIAIRRLGDEPFYDVGRVKVIDGRKAYYSVSALGGVRLNDETDLDGITWMSLYEREEDKAWRESTRNIEM